MLSSIRICTASIGIMRPFVSVHSTGHLFWKDVFVLSTRFLILSVILRSMVQIVSDKGALRTACNIVQTDGQAGHVFLPN